MVKLLHLNHSGASYLNFFASGASLHSFTSSSGFSFASFGLMMNFSLPGPRFLLVLSLNQVKAGAFVNR